MNLLDLLPSPPKVDQRPRLTGAHKSAILEAISKHSWTTAREAYGWAWQTLGIRVTYVTFWRFMNAEGLLVGDTLRSRRLSQTVAK